jgi:hypothetical protein
VTALTRHRSELIDAKLIRASSLLVRPIIAVLWFANTESFPRPVGSSQLSTICALFVQCGMWNI